ncbi:hypothetical protein E2562_034461 [Oryza meyeriana var. granulata]|uniref:Uncharacterized protein n=1 Tax=Oryza meyeriana var. granulata TaxID=110450 RepID=A0A6G1CW73_9ORYZ|nr:hypothetical protein E2562_034461 [Oryza meyeriana var. granulata]
MGAKEFEPQSADLLARSIGGAIVVWEEHRAGVEAAQDEEEQVIKEGANAVVATVGLPWHRSLKLLLGMRDLPPPITRRIEE